MRNLRERLVDSESLSSMPWLGIVRSGAASSRMLYQIILIDSLKMQQQSIIYSGRVDYGKCSKNSNTENTKIEYEGEYIVKYAMRITRDR